MTSRARLIAAVAVLALAVTGLLAAAPPASANGNCATYFNGRGTGTSSNPYQVGSRADLEEVAFCLDKHFLQVADVSLGGSSTPWTPLGNYPNPFTGTYDGGGHAVTGLFIEDLTQSAAAKFLGLFGVIDNATIRNVSVAGSVTGWQEIGGVVGRVIDGTLSNVSATVTVEGVDYLGGLIGRVRDETSSGTSSTVSNCHASGGVTGGGAVGGLIGEVLIQAGETVTISGSSATGAVTGSGAGIGGLIGGTGGLSTPPGHTAIADSWASGNVTSATTAGLPTATYVGGFAGGLDLVTVTRSFATGSVLGLNYVGGFAGGLSGTIADSFAAGAVSGHWQVGGIVGEAGGAGSVVRTYAVGLVTGTGGAVGGFAGQSYVQVLASMWDEDTSGRSNAGNGYWGEDLSASPPVPASFPTAMTTAQMTTTATFANAGWSISRYWDGGTTWATCSTYNSGYPYLPSTLAANPTGCPLAPAPSPGPAPAPEPPTPAPTPTPAPEVTPVPPVPMPPEIPSVGRPVASSVSTVRGQVVAVTEPVRTSEPAARTLAAAPTAHASVGDVIRVSVNGLPASSRIDVDLRVDGRWHRIGAASTGRHGRTTLPAWTTDKPGTYPLRIRSTNNPPLFVRVVVSAS